MSVKGSPVNTLGDLIKNLHDELVLKTGEQLRRTKHPGVIGDAWESVHHDYLEYVLPENFYVVSGQVEFMDGSVSSEIDLMIVKGEPEQIGGLKSSRYFCKYDDVVAIFEVKAKLRGAALCDGLRHLQKFRDDEWGSVINLVEKNRFPSVTQHAIKKAKLILGKPDDSGEEEFSEYHMRLLRAVMTTYVGPAKILIGSNGYSSEENLRKGIYEQVGKNNINLDINYLPDLIISQSNSIMKLLGNPNGAEVISCEGYPGSVIYAGSTNFNPFSLIIELIWTHIANKFEKEALTMFGDDLVTSSYNEFAVIVPVAGQLPSIGFITSSDSKMPDTSQKQDWCPCEIPRSVAYRLLSGGLKEDALEPSLVQKLSNRLLFRTSRLGYLQPLADYAVVIENDVKLGRAWVGENFRYLPRTSNWAEHNLLTDTYSIIPVII